jgi:hypothetical protein
MQVRPDHRSERVVPADSDLLPPRSVLDGQNSARGTSDEATGRCRSASGRWWRAYFAAVNGKKFKLDPQRLLYSLQWLHKGTLPDLHWQLVRESGEWFDSVATSPLGALNRHDPQLRDRLWAATAP